MNVLTIELTVEKMKCGGCAANVERAVKGQDAQAQVQIDLPTKKVTVQTALLPAQVADLITQAGYPASVAP
ncbi:MAG: heavy-metal-associated domain-containing protein [Limnobacter sp.]|nr:heavy-metal-associated domain-containing protein [Limnobacter sp.]